MTIIGITGTLGAGKGEVSTYFKEKGFKHFSVRDFLTLEMNRRGIPINRDTMTPLADELRKTHGPSYIIEQLYKMAEASGGNAIIESVRAIAEADFLQRKGGILISIDADQKLRYKRIYTRKSAMDDVSFEKFVSHENREFQSAEANRGNIRDCMKRADVSVINNGTIEELNAQLDRALPRILK